MSHVETLAAWHRTDIQSGAYDKSPRRSIRAKVESAIAKLWSADADVVLSANYGRRIVLEKPYVGRTFKAAMEKLQSTETGSRENGALAFRLSKVSRFLNTAGNRHRVVPIRDWLDLAIAAGQSDEELKALF